MNASRANELGAYRRLARALQTLPPIPTSPDLVERTLARLPRAESETLSSAAVETPLGRIYIAYSSRGIRFVAPAADESEFAAACARRIGVTPRPNASPPPRLLALVAAALAGDRRAAKRLPLDLEPLGAFDRAVLTKALEIPRGEVRTYGWIARELGRPEASRAVGRALGQNPIPFLIPCHRVVGSSGSLTGYAFGLPMKERILRLEGLDPDELRATVASGERFRGCRSTRIFCLPTCRYARRVQQPNVVPFSRESEARAAGYRPCRVCRPAAV